MLSHRVQICHHLLDPLLIPRVHVAFVVSPFQLDLGSLPPFSSFLLGEEVIVSGRDPPVPDSEKASEVARVYRD